MRGWILLIVLFLSGCSTEEKPIYLYCANEFWGDEWLIIDKANGLWINSTEDPQNRTEDHKLRTAKLFVDETFYRQLETSGTVRTNTGLDRRNLVYHINVDFGVSSECEIIDPIPELRAEGMAQELPKI
tara:strand:- start:571 stop:957 length:387 start_codon:yes stop_codon:yes gene_type:complete